MGHHLGWTFSNLAFPYLFPILLFKFIQILKLDVTERHIERMRISYLLKEGQFALSNCAVSAAAMFELLAENASRGWVGVVLIVSLVLLGLISALIFVLGTIFGSPAPDTVPLATIGYGAWLKQYRVGAASLYTAAAVCVCAFAAHWHVTEHLSQKATKAAMTATEGTGVSPK